MLCLLALLLVAWRVVCKLIRAGWRDGGRIAFSVDELKGDLVFDLMLNIVGLVSRCTLSTVSSACR